MFSDRNLLLAVIGLVILTLLLASLYRKYQEAQAMRRQRVAMLLAGVEQLERILGQTTPLGLSRELRVLSRKELVRRLKAVQATYARYPHIQERIHQARSQVDTEGATAPSRQKSTDKALLTGQLNVLAELRHILVEGGFSEPVAPSELPGFLHELDEARVRVQFDYHLAMYELYCDENARAKARSHLVALTKMIDGVRLKSEVITALREEAERLSKQEFEASLKEEVGVQNGTAQG